MAQKKLIFNSIVVITLTYVCLLAFSPNLVPIDYYICVDVSKSIDGPELNMYLDVIKSIINNAIYVSDHVEIYSFSTIWSKLADMDLVDNQDISLKECYVSCSTQLYENRFVPDPYNEIMGEKTAFVAILDHVVVRQMKRMDSVSNRCNAVFLFSDCQPDNNNQGMQDAPFEYFNELKNVIKDENKTKVFMIGVADSLADATSRKDRMYFLSSNIDTRSIDKMDSTLTDHRDRTSRFIKYIRSQYGPETMTIITIIAFILDIMVILGFRLNHLFL